MFRQHILIIVQNLPVPLDRRVWLECQALRDSGYEVSVVCPKGPGDRTREAFEGVHLYKYAPPPPSSGTFSYIAEFGYCWIRTAVLSVVVAKRRPITVIQACNPPDTYWALAVLWKWATRGRVKFVFDHHDLNPEVFLSRFGAPASWLARAQLAGLRWLERRTLRTAEHVISTNDSYREVAIGRGGVDPQRITVVRSGPDVIRMRPIDPSPELRQGRRWLLVYLGIMGPQDGVDLVIRLTDVLVHDLGLDVHTALLGFGDSLPDLVELAETLNVSDNVTFTGRADPRMIGEYLSSADVGLSPDPLNPLNDVSTMNKTMEYMAYALPVVAFDLSETRVSGGGSVLYIDPVAPGCVTRFADAVAELLGNPELRAEMALAGRMRAEQVLDWRTQSDSYVQVFDELIGGDGHRSPRSSSRSVSGADEWGRPFIDVSDDGAIRALMAKRASRFGFRGVPT